MRFGYFSLFNQLWQQRQGEQRLQICIFNEQKQEFCTFCTPSAYIFHSRELKKLRRLQQRKRHIKIELYVRLSVLRLFQVGHVVQRRRSALSLAWHRWFSCKDKEWKIYCCGLALSEAQKLNIHVVIWQTTSKICTKERAARAARLFFLIQTSLRKFFF